MKALRFGVIATVLLAVSTGASARYLESDPIGLEGGWNSYLYAISNPLRYTDPTGLLAGGMVNAGESYGDSAAQYWADTAVRTGNPLYHIPGALAALWTPCTSDATASTLVGGYGARLFGPFSTRGLPPYLQRARKYIRLDPPHHNKTWQLDGTIPSSVRRWLGR